MPVQTVHRCPTSLFTRAVNGWHCLASMQGLYTYPTDSLQIKDQTLPSTNPRRYVLCLQTAYVSPVSPLQCSDRLETAPSAPDWRGPVTQPVGHRLGQHTAEPGGRGVGKGGICACCMPSGLQNKKDSLSDLAGTTEEALNQNTRA